MPPAESPLTEQDRFRVSSWINEQLRLTACDLGESAGIVTLRRLTRRDYGNTIRDMMGVNFAVEDLFPADGSGGEGFDTNGETLFVPPLMMERYLDAAEQILSRAIVSPPFERSFAAEDMQPAKPAPVDEARRLEPGERISEEFLLYNEADYNFLITVDRARLKPVEFVLEIDGEEAERFTMDIEVFGSATSRQKRDSPGARAAQVRPESLPRLRPAGCVQSRDRRDLRAAKRRSPGASLWAAGPRTRGVPAPAAQNGRGVFDEAFAAGLSPAGVQVRSRPRDAPLRSLG